MNETALEAKWGHHNFSSESKKKICSENVVISEVQGKNDTGIVGLLSSSTQNSYGFRSVRENGFECETLRCSEILLPFNNKYIKGIIV